MYVKSGKKAFSTKFNHFESTAASLQNTEVGLAFKIRNALS